LHAEQAVRRAVDQGLDATIVRPGLILGAVRLGIIERVFDRAIDGSTITILGDGENRYELTHVEDVVRLLVAAANRPGFGVYNVGSTSVPTMRSWIERVVDTLGSTSSIVSVPATTTKLALSLLETVALSPLRREQYAIADEDYLLDSRKAQRELGWKPEWSGLEATLDTLYEYMDTRGVRSGSRLKASTRAQKSG
jgi:dTDP-glucose 4,6-dehydratase